MQEQILIFPDEAARARLRDKKEIAHPRRTFWQDAFYRFKKRRVAVVGSIILISIVLMTILGPFIYQASFSEINFTETMQPPSFAHPLGTNDMGQDMLARVLNGGCVSIAVGIFAMLVSILVGTVVGASSGFFGGIVDDILMRVTDLFISLPTLPLLMVVIFLFRDSIKRVVGPEMGVFILIVFVIGILHWMSVARLVRASVLSIRETDYVTAARSMGASPYRLLRRHILPNVLSPVIVAATLAVGSAITQELTLSFLGLGFPPDTPTWGRMLHDARNYLDISPILAIVPGTVIFLTVLCINAVGDGLRDALDPRMGER